MITLAWLGFQPKQNGEAEEKTRLSSDGARIEALNAQGMPRLEAIPGARIALSGSDTYRKHFFCDWILGFTDVPGSSVRIQVGETLLSTPNERIKSTAVLGRSPLLYGETIQESLLYRTQNVRKNDLHALIERLYGPSLRARTSPQNPMCDSEGQPVATRSLTAREHLEIAQINLILQRTPIVILDLSSELMTEALAEGFRPCAELLTSGKTILAILPPNRDIAWAESILGSPFSSEVQFS